MANHPDGPLRVLLQFMRAQDAGDPYAFRFKPQDYILPTAGGDSPTSRFDWTAEALADLQAVRLPGRDPAVVQRLGEQLRRFVKDAGWAQHEKDIAQALVGRRPIFLTIRSSAAELYALPWELLTLKSGQYIGGVDGLLLRFEWPESKSAVEQPAPRPEGGRILLAWSAAGGPVPDADHQRAIAAACSAGFHGFDAATDVLADASLERIVKKLEAAQQAGSPVAVLHLLCHGAAAGTTFGLCLNGERGRVVVDAAQLRDQLAPFASMVRLVVLSACDSGNAGAIGNQLGSVAQALHRDGFQAVLASRFPLSVDGSTALTESLYAELLSGPSSLEAAFLAARKRLARAETNLPRDQQRLDWASVQLYARHDDGDDTRPIVFRPYRGLLAFQPEHRRFFFGRDHEVQEILGDLQALIDHKKERFLVVAGASGTGKSSLVFAGGVPRLLENNPQLAFLRMRPGSHPDRALNEVLAERPAGRLALLVVDQFEELFIQTAASADRDAFVRRLWSLASAPESGLCILITLRVDYIGRCGDLRLDDAGLRLDQIAYAEAYRIFVAQLRPEQLRAAIVEPARKVGLELEAGLADRMLQDVGGEPGALPLLADALDVLWQHRSGRTLTQRAYAELGGAVGALQQRADAILDKLLPEEQTLAQRLLVNLVAVADNTALDSRLRVAVAELRPPVAAAQASGFERVLKALVEARLLVLDDDKQAPTVEVAHEALIRTWPRLRAWLDEDRAGLVAQRRVRHAAQQWALQKRDESLLYRGAQLLQATDWRKTWDARLGDLERRFLDESDALRVRQETQETERQRRELEAAERLAEEKQQKLEAARELAQRTRLAAVVFGLLFAVAVVFGVLAGWQAIEARRKADQAHDNLLVALAPKLIEDPAQMMTVLQEVKDPDFPLWIQSASDALLAGRVEKVVRGFPSPVIRVAYSPDGTKIAVVSEDGSVRLGDVNGTGTPARFEGPAASALAIAFSPDGTKLAIGSTDRTASIWKLDRSAPPVVLKDHESAVAAVAFSPDGTKLATGSVEAILRLWNADGSGAPLILPGSVRSPEAVIGLHKRQIIIPSALHKCLDAVTSLAFSRDGKKLVAGSMNNKARVWNADGTTDPVEFEGHAEFITSVAFSPAGDKIVTGSGDQTARVWNLKGSSAPIVLRGHEGEVYSVAYSPDGSKIVTGSKDKTVRIWTVDGSSSPRVLKGHELAVTSAAYNGDGSKLVTGSLDQTVRIWTVDGKGAVTALLGNGSAIWAVALSGDGKKLVTGTRWSAVIQNFPGTAAPVVNMEDTSLTDAIACSPDGKKVVVVGPYEVASIRNLDGSGAPVRLVGHEQRVSSVAYSADGKKIATGSPDSTVRLWDASGAPLAVLPIGAPVWAVAFSPDGRKLIIGCEDSTARIRNIDGSGAPVLLKGHQSPIVAVAFSPDGKSVVTGSSDHTARIWKADGTGTPAVLKGHASAITSVAISRDGTRIVTGSEDATARVWRADGAGAPVVLRLHASSVTAVAFSPDGKKVVTGSRDGTARSWTVTSEELWDALWNATGDCLSEASRLEILGESATVAREGYARCRQKTAQHRAGSPRPPG